MNPTQNVTASGERMTPPVDLRASGTSNQPKPHKTPPHARAPWVRRTWRDEVRVAVRVLLDDRLTLSSVALAVQWPADLHGLDHLLARDAGVLPKPSCRPLTLLRVADEPLKF